MDLHLYKLCDHVLSFVYLAFLYLLANFRITDRTYCEVSLTTRYYTRCSCGDLLQSNKRRRSLLLLLHEPSKKNEDCVGSTVSLTGSLGNSNQVVANSSLLLSTFGGIWCLAGLLTLSVLWVHYRRRRSNDEKDNVHAQQQSQESESSLLDQGRVYSQSIIPSIFVHYSSDLEYSYSLIILSCG